jgi:hypothetical protein
MLLDPDPEQHSQYEFGSRSRSQMSADPDRHDWFFDRLLALNFSCKKKIQLFVSLTRIRIRMDPHCFGPLDLDPDCIELKSYMWIRIETHAVIQNWRRYRIRYGEIFVQLLSIFPVLQTARRSSALVATSVRMGWKFVQLVAVFSRLGSPGRRWCQSHTGSILNPNLDDLLNCRYLSFVFFQFLYGIITMTHRRFVRRIRESRLLKLIVPHWRLVASIADL